MFNKLSDYFYFFIKAASRSLTLKNIVGRFPGHGNVHPQNNWNGIFGLLINYILEPFFSGFCCREGIYCLN